MEIAIFWFRYFKNEGDYEGFGHRIASSINIFFNFPNLNLPFIYLNGQQSLDFRILWTQQLMEVANLATISFLLNQSISDTQL